MKKDDLIAEIATKANVSKAVASATLDATVAAISKSLAAGGEVRLSGLGTFKTNLRNARTARNPRTGETVNIPAKRVGVFKAGKELTTSLNA